MAKHDNIVKYIDSWVEVELKEFSNFEEEMENFTFAKNLLDISFEDVDTDIYLKSSYEDCILINNTQYE